MFEGFSLTSSGQEVFLPQFTVNMWTNPTAVQCGARLCMLTCPPLSLYIVLQTLISKLTVGFRLWRQVCWKTTHQTQHGGAALTQKLKTLLWSLSSTDRHSLCSGCNRRSHLVFHINASSFFHGTATRICHPGTQEQSSLPLCLPFHVFD